MVYWYDDDDDEDEDEDEYEDDDDDGYDAHPAPLYHHPTAPAVEPHAADIAAFQSITNSTLAVAVAREVVRGQRPDV